MSKTLQDLAKRYKAKKPALYARLKKLESEQPETELYYKQANVLYLTETGLKLLEADLKANPINTKTRARQEKQDSQPQPKLQPEQDRELIDSLKAQIKTLEQQLEAKDRTIDRLLSVIEGLNSNYSQSLSESHTLTSQQQTIKAIELSQPEATATKQPDRKRKSLISKIIFTGKLFKGDYD